MLQNSHSLGRRQQRTWAGWEQEVTKPRQRGAERKEKLLRAPALQQRCNVARGRSIIGQGLVSHSTVSRASGLPELLARDCSLTGPRENSCRNQLFLRPMCEIAVWGEHVHSFHKDIDSAKEKTPILTARILAFEENVVRSQAREAIEIRDRRPEVNHNGDWQLD